MQYISLSIFLLLFVLTAFADQKTTVENYLRHRIYGEEFTGDTKCGTVYHLILSEMWRELDSSKKLLYTQVIQQDTGRTHHLITPGGHFRLNWNEAGSHAVPLADISGNGYPDYIDSAAVIFDRVWEIEINQLGYPPPPDNNGNPVSVYNIYFSNIRYYGQTLWDPSREITSLPGTNFATWIEVHNNYNVFYSRGLDGLRVTAAHEFHHAIQLGGYNVRESGVDYFFYEMTSTWIEDKLYPSVKDYYQYLPYLFRNFSNQKFYYFYDRFQDATVFPYGNALYLIMLEMEFGPEIVRAVWENIRSTEALNALISALSKPPYNRSWQESMNQYAMWLYYTGSRSLSGKFFPNAMEYPELYIQPEDRINFQGTYDANTRIEKQASRFLLLNGINIPDIFFYTGTTGMPAGGVRQLSDLIQSEFIGLNKIFSNQVTGQDVIVLAISNASDASKDFHVTIDNSVAEEIAISENPVIATDEYKQVHFKVPLNADVYIFNVSGQLITRLPGDDTLFRIWNLKNEQGKSVASGVYLYYIKSDTMEKLGKLSVIR